MAMQRKVKEVNLERGHPTVETALRDLVNQLATAKGRGFRAVILIHGYGSSGQGGGKIKSAVAKKLKEPSLSGLVREVCPGEAWMERKKAFQDVCPQLKDFASRIQGNAGVTVVLLR